MSRARSVFLGALVAAGCGAALAGCDPAGPAAIPVPVQVYLPGISFTCAADAALVTGLYRWDGEGACYADLGTAPTLDDVAVYYAEGLSTISSELGTFVNDAVWDKSRGPSGLAYAQVEHRYWLMSTMISTAPYYVYQKLFLVAVQGRLRWLELREDGSSLLRDFEVYPPPASGFVP